MISERIFKWLSDEENLVRILKYWWVVSAIRVSVGLILFLIIVFKIFDLASLR